MGAVKKRERAEGVVISEAPESNRAYISEGPV